MALAAGRPIVGRPFPAPGMRAAGIRLIRGESPVFIARIRNYRIIAFPISAGEIPRGSAFPTNGHSSVLNGPKRRKGRAPRPAE